MDTREMTEAFLVKKYNDLKEKTLQFTLAILNLELEIKAIKEQIKEVKAEAKVEGIAVKEIMKTLAILKKDRNTSEQDKAEISEMLDFFQKEPSILQIIDDLISK